MNRYRHIFAATALLALCVSCDQKKGGEVVTPSAKIEGVSFTLGGITTKAAKAQFSTDNQIGVQAYSTSGDQVEVATYSYNKDGVFVSAAPIDYSDENPKLSYIACHPNMCGESTHFEFVAGRNQSSIESYVNSDLLVSKVAQTSDEQPKLNFYHVMSNLQVTINITKSGEPYSFSDLQFNAILKQECDIVNESYTVARDAEVEAIKPAHIEGNNYGIVVASQIVTLADGFASLKVDGETITMSDEVIDEIILAWGHQEFYEWNIDVTPEVPAQEVKYIGGSVQDWIENEEVEAPDTTVGEIVQDTDFDSMIDDWGTTEGDIVPASYDWDDVAMPIPAPAGKKWVLSADHSDDFNYESKNGSLHTTFNSKWTDFYHNSWTGPSPTYWKRDHVSVSGGNLRIIASRDDSAPDMEVTSGDKTATMPATYSGCITSTKRVNYPVYIEACAQLSNSTMASDVWLLSPDDTQEIDIIEAYGAQRANGYGQEYLHLSHHVFVRDPFQDYQPQDAGSWYKDNKGTIWREDYHRVGVYWVDPLTLKYYVDGVCVRTVSGKTMIDPYDYTEGTGLSKDMDIIINMEDQSWRAIKGLSPTDAELENRENCTFKVDWIRVYKLVSE